MKKLWNQRDKELNDQLFSHIVVGMAPYGGVAVWFVGVRKSILIDWFHCEEISVNMSDFVPTDPTISLQDYCNFYIDNDEQVKSNLVTNGLPDKELFNKLMKQFCYKYKTIFEKDKQIITPKIVYIEESLFDGTLDKVHENNLIEYNNAGIPQKLSLNWKIDNSKYTAYFWFDEKQILDTYDKFYVSNKETKAEFIIRIDPYTNKYQLSLENNETKHTVVVDQNTYQMIVFKDDFSCYRSENYNQEKGAWVW